MQLGNNGKLGKTKKSQTISESIARASKLKEQLLNRSCHHDIVKYCNTELNSDNYFHAVFEAAKSVTEKIRNKTGLISDGSKLVDEAFSFNGKTPYLALNSLESETDRSEQNGFIHLLKGLFGMFRNDTAHTPKIRWKVDETDALDILSLTSLAHRRIDNSIEAKKYMEHCNKCQSQL